MSAKVVGFIGTGVMGSSMARHLLDKGHPSNVYNRTRERARALMEAGAVWCDTPAEVARRSEVVISIVGTPVDVAGIYQGPEGVLENLAPGSLAIDMTTSDPELASALAATG